MKQQYYKRVFANKVTYKGIEFNSKMEADFAMFLDGVAFRYKNMGFYHKPIKWEYETKQFTLIEQENWVDKTEKDNSVKRIRRNKKHTLQQVIYTPDFYLPDYDLLIEIKGVQFDDGLFAMRLRLFRHKFPEKALAIIRHHEEFYKLDEILENIKINEIESK